MKFTTLTTLLPLLPLSLAIPITSRDTAPTTCGRRNTPEYCAGTNYTESLLSTYLCGDSRLGPTRLPALYDDLPVAPVLATALFGYDRFGGLCPGAFLEKWLNPAEGWWQYPPQDGFVVADPAEETGNREKGKRAPAVVEPGKPIDGNVTLAVNTLVDRFGSEYGNFVSPAGAPYGQRALPPSNLATQDPAYVFLVLLGLWYVTNIRQIPIQLPCVHGDQAVGGPSWADRAVVRAGRCRRAVQAV